MNLNFNHLKALQAVAKYESITKAAKSLDMTQPAVSVQLKNLQDQFDVPLTEVIGKKVHITEFGLELVEMSERIFSEMNQIEQRMKELKGLLAGKIRISAVSTGKYIIPYLISEFMKLHPHVEISLEVSNRYKVLAHLEENSTDLAFLSISPEDLDLDSVTLAENKWYLACFPEHSEKFQSLIDQDKWGEIPFILREKGSGTRVIIERFFEDRDIAIKSRMELSTNEAVKQAVMAGLGVSVLSLYSMRSEVADGRIKLLEFKGLPIKAHWRLVWLKQKRHQPAVMAFIRWLTENNQEVFGKLLNP